MEAAGRPAGATVKAGSADGGGRTDSAEGRRGR